MVLWVVAKSIYPISSFWGLNISINELVASTKLSNLGVPPTSSAIEPEVSRRRNILAGLIDPELRFGVDETVHFPWGHKVSGNICPRAPARAPKRRVWTLDSMRMLTLD